MTSIPYRRVVPAGYTEATLTLTGTAPLLMNSGEVDRESDEYRAFAVLSKQRSKSLDDDARLREMEWALALYLDEELGPYVPGKNVHELLRAAATKWKRGEDVKRSLVVVQNRVPLQYDGPRDQATLWEKGYRYQAMVANAGFNRGRVVRCRPCFDQWIVEAELAFDPEDLDPDTLALIVERSQKYGLGDYRPTFGAFAAELTIGTKKKDGARVDGRKQRDRRTERAHTAQVKRVVRS
jgi:hypothetical protein